MQLQLGTTALTQKEHQEIERLLSFSVHSPMEITDLWKMMDIVWDELGCDSSNLQPEKISEYYSHPVWTLNGLFIEQDDVSMQHREAIASWIADNQISSVLDYGGGFGTLARLIAAKDKNIAVDIHEPFPSQLAIAKVQEFSNIQFVNSLHHDYACLVCIDVLEHVPNPMELFAMMIESVKIGGFLIVANCFYPEIKCHLPASFHFRHTFNSFARAMNLRIVGRCEGSHAIIYKKVTGESPDWNKIRRLEKSSEAAFPVNEFFSFNLNLLKQLAKTIIGSQNSDTLKMWLKGLTTS